MSIILKAENISKQYRLGLVGTGTLRHDINRWWSKVRGKDDPFLKVGEANDRSTKGNSDYVWALQDINFEVKQGEVLGIIGKNGAGKSTLLKILSRVTGPTTGEIKTKGRIASLLEVGTGFHPEMTGRENIYLNGAILGMTKTEIKAKEHEIIDFSGCERYIDTPVKRYSSGMTVRLAFAVAAHLEPDILVIDEVLAVGDAEFQKKAIGKMQDISQGEGRTVLFVSHNMAAVRNLCTRAMVLQNGVSVFEGDTNEAVDFYLKASMILLEFKVDDRLLKNSFIDGFNISNISIAQDVVYSGSSLTINIKYKATKKFIASAFVIKVKDINEVELFRLSNMPISGFKIEHLYNEGLVSISVHKLPLIKGKYLIDVGFVRQNVEWYFNLENVISLEVKGADVYNSGFELDRTRGIIWVNHEWNHHKL